VNGRGRAGKDHEKEDRGGWKGQDKGREGRREGEHILPTMNPGSATGSAMSV